MCALGGREVLGCQIVACPRVFLAFRLLEANCRTQMDCVAYVGAGLKLTVELRLIADVDADMLLVSVGLPGEPSLGVLCNFVFCGTKMHG